jgi:L-ascorbate metabolism protein UlaG (beta-lactamase superfamily)
MKLAWTTSLACFLTAACVGSADLAQADTSQSRELNLLYVANEGVLVSSRHEKVLIDALFTRPNPAYMAPPAELLERIFAGDAPFDDLNLVLVTHNHPDHFDPAAVGRFLIGNSHAVLVGPEDATEALRDSVAEWSEFSDRVVSVALAPGSSATYDLDGIGVTAYRTLHSGQQEDPQNLMYLIEIGGKTVFHEGDSDGHPDTFGRFDLGERHIDLALVHFWLPTDLEGSRTLREILRAEHIGLFHLPIRLMEDAPGTIAQVADDYSDMFLMVHPGETRSFAMDVREESS